MGQEGDARQLPGPAQRGRLRVLRPGGAAAASQAQRRGPGAAHRQEPPRPHRHSSGRGQARLVVYQKGQKNTN